MGKNNTINETNNVLNSFRPVDLGSYYLFGRIAKVKNKMKEMRG